VIKNLAKEILMTRFTSRLALLALGVFLLLPVARAQSTDNDGCSDQTVKGDYAFRISGELFVPGATPASSILAYRDGVAMTHFDGQGNLRQVDFVMGNGKVPGDPTQPTYTALADIDPLTGFSTNETGTYHVFADCTGWAKIEFPPAEKTVNGSTITVSPGAVIKLMFVVANGGNTLHTIVSALNLPGGAPALPNIHSDAERLVPLSTQIY
jgi:hypothetical protein